MTSDDIKFIRKNSIDLDEETSDNSCNIEEIIDSSMIIDSLSHGPILWDDKINLECERMLESKMNLWKIIQELVFRVAKRIVLDDDYFSKYLAAWRTSRVSCVSWTLGPIYERPYSFEGVFHNFAFMTYLIENRKELFMKILKSDDIEQAYKEKKIGVIFNLQNLNHIGTNIDLLELYYMMGIKIMQLTYNTKNLIGTGCTVKTDRGLTEFGEKIIEKLNDLNILIDISHCGPKTSMDAAVCSKAPILASHTFSKKLYEHDRGKDDKLFEVIAENKGYIGILVANGFLTERSKTTIDDWVDHIEYVIDLVGLEHVGIGTDFYGFSLPKPLEGKVDEIIEKIGFHKEHRINFSEKVEGFEDYTKFPNLIKRLSDRGYNSQKIRKIAGENFLNVFKKVVG